MHGLKNVGHRYDDALSRVDWMTLERLLANYYREVGWWVEHIGTGGTGAAFDGGVDLRIRRDAQVVLVQCKHWNAKQVPHNAVRELIGVMVNQGATGAILISSGEFTEAAIEAANRHGHVKLIDGATLRDMLGPLPEPHATGPEPEPEPVRHASAPRRASPAVPAQGHARLRHWLFGLGCAIAFVFVVLAILRRTADTAVEPSNETVPAQAARPAIVSHDEPTAASARTESTVRAPSPRKPTAAEIRESQRKAEEAIEAIADDTPEM